MVTRRECEKEGRHMTAFEGFARKGKPVKKEYTKKKKG